MSTPRRKSDPERHRRYRAAKRAQGLREIRLWVTDHRRPGFAEEAARQAALLRDAPDEQHIMAEIESLMLEWDDWKA
jgi:hypothetical protein